MISEAKPFYIYEEDNCLYIKNINGKIEKLANNVVTYSANFDDNDFIHICLVDIKGRLIHFIYKNGRARKRTLCKVCNNIKNLKNMRLFIIEKFLNIFLIEESSLNEDTYRVAHYNFTPTNYKLSRYHFNNIMKKDDYIYKLNIDDMQNMIFSFDSSDNNRGNLNNHSLVFNNNERKWYPIRSLMRGNENIVGSDPSSNIRIDIFEYCHSIKYKNNL